MSIAPYQYQVMPRLYPNWEADPNILIRLWDEAMTKIEQLETRVAVLEALVP